MVLGVALIAGNFALAEEAAKQDAGIVSITLPIIETKLPDAPGRQTVLTTCVLCHSPRYITMQPKVARAAWTAGVDKMRKTFGAPMTDAQAAEVVNYLVAIRGLEPAK